MALSLFILLSLLVVAVPVQGQQGFISIDCGIAEELNYTDNNTKIVYTSDAKFIETGTNKEISGDYMSEKFPRQYQNLRFFPEGNRNCYTLTPVVKSIRYLVRASFMYGNYDGLNKTPQFDVYVGVNRWNVSLPSTAKEMVWNEIIMYTTMDYVSVCLVNIGRGIPFISQLELRPLNNLTYRVVDESQSLGLLYRNHFRSTASGPIRYPDDTYDRMWTSMVVDGWTPINNSSPINLWVFTDNRPPMPVLNTAAIPYDPNGNLSFNFPTSNLDLKLQYQVYLYFAELEQLQRNQSREFNINVDGNYFAGPFSPRYLYENFIYTDSPFSGKNPHGIDFDFFKTSSSTLPPIFNAVEIFALQPLSATPTDSRDVEAIMNIKAIYQIKRNWMSDPCVPTSYIWEGLNCSYPDSKPPTIISLDLSSSRLTGELAHSLANLTSIQYLDVSNNSLTGHVPDFLGELSSLKILKLTNNRFTGSIPAVLLEKSKNGSLSLSFDNNANLSHCELAGSCKKRRKILVPILASSISALVMLIIMVFALWKLTQRRRQRAPIFKTKKDVGFSNNNQYMKSGSVLNENRRFTYAEVVSIANNFKRCIGKGGFGTVYQGQMTDGTKVAVKILSLQSVKSLCHTRQGSNEFRNEVQLLMRVHHRNLVTFIGYCHEGGNMALIYEYMAQGNLGSHLSGLEYLHNGCKPPIIHRDVKPANILLNERLEAKIGDFGLSKVFSDEFSHVSTAVKGTFGYLDPEYCKSNNLTEKSDVYSFGVVLLQLITGQPAIVQISNYERRSLIDWAISMVVEGDIKDVIDPKLEDSFDIKSIQKVVEIARACTLQKSVERPTMKDIVVELKEFVGSEKALESSSKSGGLMHSGQVHTSSEILSYLSAR